VDQIVESKEHQESFVRWQGVTVAQLGYAIGLLLTIATAILGFAFSLLKDKSFSPTGCVKCLFSSALILLTSSIVLGLLCVINRLVDFRETTAIARDREQWRREGSQPDLIDSKLRIRRDHTKVLGRRSWRLFWAQAMSAGFGAIFLIVDLVIFYHSELF
jgi:hypothetical protein